MPFRSDDNSGQISPGLLLDSPTDDSDNDMFPQELPNTSPHAPTPQVQRSARIPKQSAIGTASKGVVYTSAMDRAWDEVRASEWRRHEQRETHHDGGVLDESPDTPELFCVSDDDPRDRSEERG